MRVSVVIPCYDMADFVGETIESVLAQTHRDVEIVAVDDGSNDGSFRVLESFGSRVRAARQAHAGGCRARNHGLSLSTGAAVLFLDADDRIAPQTLAALSAVLEASTPDSTVATCDWLRLVESAGSWETSRRGVPQPPADGDLLAAWLLDFYIPPCALLWPRSLVESLGGWDERLTISQDTDLALRALAAGVRMRRADAGLAFYRYHQSRRTVSRGNSREDFLSKLRVYEKLHDQLQALGQLERYRVPLGRAFHALARFRFAAHPELARATNRRAEQVAGRHAVHGSLLHLVFCHLLGLERKERLAAALAEYGLGVPGRLSATRKLGAASGRSPST